MARCLVSFGANVGNAADTLRQSAASLQKLLSCDAAHFRLSRLFRTPPVGGPSGQPPFVNAVAAIDTPLSEWEVWEAIRLTEQRFGRRRNRRWEARKIDLDILLYDDRRIWRPQLKIPHPRMCMRRFILVPAAEVAADWIDPVTGQSVGQLCRALDGTPGSLTLVADDARQATWMLEAVARSALAQWRCRPREIEAEHDENPSTRWVSLLSPAELASAAALPSAKLCVYLAKAIPVEDAAPEDYHRQLAASLNLVSENETTQLPISGSRYLLSAEDPDWAVHEMVAALEAMDCPVEPL